MHQFLSLFLSCVLAMPAMAASRESQDDPIVSTTQLRERLRASAETRGRHIEQVERFLRHEAVQGALHSVKLDADRIATAASLLSDDELARLSVRSAQIERDIAAGAFSNLMLTYIVIALCTAVLVLILVS